MLTLKHELTYRLKMKGPLPTTSGSPMGERQYWEMSEGILTGEKIQAHIAMPGGDWMLIGTDGFWRPDVRTQFLTDDKAVILLQYTGLVKPDARFLQAARDGRETQFEDQYLVQLMRFDTGAQAYAWLAQNLYVAEGRLVGPAEIEYRIFQISQ